MERVVTGFLSTTDSFIINQLIFPGEMDGCK